MADTVRVIIDTGRLPVTPGKSASLEVRIYNAARIVDELVVVPVGLDESWVQTEPTSVSLLPDTEGRVRVTVALPRDAPLPAGEHLVGIKVSSIGSSGASRVEELVLDVAPIHQSTISIEPQLVRGGRSADFRVRVENQGNQPLILELAGQDPEGVVRFGFAPPRLEVQPRADAVSRLSAAAPRALTGNEVQRALTVAARGGGTELMTRATFAQRPWLSRGLLKLIPLLVALAVGGVALAVTSGGDDSGEAAETTSSTGSSTTTTLGIKQWDHEIDLKRGQVSFYIRPRAGEIKTKTSWKSPPTNLRAEVTGPSSPAASKAGKSELTTPAMKVTQAALATGDTWRVRVADESNPPPAMGVLPVPTKGETEITYAGGSGKGPFPFELSFARGRAMSVVVLSSPGTVSATTDVTGQVTMRLYRVGESDPVKEVSGTSLSHNVTKSQYDDGRTWWVEVISATVGTASMEIEHP